MYPINYWIQLFQNTISGGSKIVAGGGEEGGGVSTKIPQMIFLLQNVRKCLFRNTS